MKNLGTGAKGIFSLEQYSKETLIELIRTYSKLYIALDGFWYLATKGELGNDKALKRDMWVWEKMHKRELDGIIKVLNIQERDMISFLRVVALTPWFHQTEYEVDLKGPNHAILTINHCPTLIALEKEGEGREQEICNVVDVDYFDKFAKRFNANLEFSPINLPPREEKAGFCCQWELKLS